MKNSEHKISIIVPVYKAEKYIDRCIKSLLNQSYKNFEIILIDDNSPDRCPQICDEYSINYPNISVIHLKESNEGASDARNIGVEKSTGKYITFVDSDDFVHEKLLEVLINLIAEENVLMSMCSYALVYNQSVANNGFEDEETVQIITDHQAIDLLIDNQTTCALWAKLYDKSLFQYIKFPVGKHNEDMFITPILYQRAKKIALSNQNLYYYFQQGESLSRGKFSYNMLDRIEAIRLWRKLVNLYYPQLIEKSNIHYFSNIIYMSQYLAHKKDTFGIKIFREYKKEIMANYNYIINSKHTTLNNKIKVLTIRLSLFRIFLFFLKYIQVNNINKSI